MTSRIWKKLKQITKTKAPLIRHSRHVACIVYKNKIISIGMARYKTHPLMIKFQSNVERVYLHAEIDALIRAINKIGTELLPECDLYVYRMTKGYVESNSKPCDGCAKALDSFGLKNIYWSTN